MTKNSQRKEGFTLLELLVVVLIIGILAAIALPQYQKAVLKSRFSGLMPIASAIANGQEIYYMEKGNYTSDITKLDIKAPSGSTNVNIEVSDGTDERFEYVLAAKDDLPGLAYVIYQKRSPQFPDTVMCEANGTLNSKATWLCKDVLKGTEVSTGSLLGSGWTAYIIKGAQGNSTFSRCIGSQPANINLSNGVTGTAACNEETGEYQYTWAGGTVNDSGKEVRNWSSMTFVNGTTVLCTGAGQCQGSVFADGAGCVAQQSGGCINTTIADGGFCKAETTSYIYDCELPTYSGTGCCASGCRAGSNKPKCSQSSDGKYYWDGESYW